MAIGDTATVRLNEGEPLENVPRSVAEIGQDILSKTEETPGIWALEIRKIVP